MKKHMPKAALHLLPGFGHVTVAQDPALINRLLEEAFAEADKRLEAGRW